MEKLILLWLPLQGDVQCRHISSESYIVIICKLISTCDLLRRGFSLGRPGRARLKDVPGRLGGSYYITVLYGKPITNGDSIRTLIAFLNNIHTNKNNNMADMSGAKRHAWHCLADTVNNNNNNNKSIQPDWLKTTLTEVADMVKCIF